MFNFLKFKLSIEFHATKTQVSFETVSNFKYHRNYALMNPWWPKLKLIGRQDSLILLYKMKFNIWPHRGSFCGPAHYKGDLRPYLTRIL